MLRVRIGRKGGRARSGDLELFAPARALIIRSTLIIRNYIEDSSLLAANSFIFSSVLSLEPHGQQFDQAIQLRFPFTAVGDWNLRLLRADCGDSEVPNKWNTVLEYNTATGEIKPTTTDCSYDFENSTLNVTHFCRYCWVGDPIYNSKNGRKRMYCSVFGYQPYANQNNWVFFVLIHDGCRDIFEVRVNIEIIVVLFLLM